MSMTQKGRQHRQAPFNIFAGPIPLNEGVKSESVAKVVKPRSGVIGWSAQANLTREIVEGSVHRREIQATATIVEQKAR